MRQMPQSFSQQGLQSGAPVYAEIAENDKIIAAAEFTNFIFGDILSSDAAQ